MYSVNFTLVGSGKGSYSIKESLATGNVFEYVGKNTGSYDPIIQLIAPSKLQIAAFNSNYNPSEETDISLEIALSNDDQNLFSEIDDNKNKGIATKINWKQILIDKNWKLKTNVDYQFIQENFSTIQRFQTVEFNRDWNLVNPTGNQQQILTNINLEKEKNKFSYSFNRLSFSDNFEGNKHLFLSHFKLNKTFVNIYGSLLENNSDTESSSFLRINGKLEQSFRKTWLGTFIQIEDNDRENPQTNQKILTSHKFQDYQAYFGVGDSTKVYAKIGGGFRTNDSIRNNQFIEINKRKTLFLDSKLIKNKKTNLSIFANYRITENTFTDNEKSLNSKLNYNQIFWKNFVGWNTSYETSSGNIPRQDYIYVEVETGQGVYTWIDYNENGLQELDEFEIAEFQDQANYLRMPLPNLSFIASQRIKLSQTITINPNQWKQKKGIKKFLSQFYNQTFIQLENEQERQEDSFKLNPFDFNKETQISLLYSLRNSFYFNRNLERYSTTYTYGNTESKQQFFIGPQENYFKVHQLDFQHKIGNFWVVDFMMKKLSNTLLTDNFESRNYKIHTLEAQPKLNYLYNKDNRFSFYYQIKNKENQLANFETLTQQKIGVEYLYLSKKKNQFTGNYTLFLNNFDGNPNSPVGYQMLEGLQVGTNMTWNLLWNQKLNSFLNLSLSYFGRQSENTRTVHTGSIQLKALF